MAKREKLLQSIKTEQGPTVEVKLDYRMGGMNYFQGVNQSRGIYLSVTSVKVTESSCGKYRTRSYTAVCHCIKETKRFNASELDKTQPSEELLEKMLNHVAQKNNLTYIRADG